MRDPHFPLVEYILLHRFIVFKKLGLYKNWFNEEIWQERISLSVVI